MNILPGDEMEIFCVGNIKPHTRIQKILMNKHDYLKTSSFSLILFFPIPFKIFLLLLETLFRYSWDSNGQLLMAPGMCYHHVRMF